MHVLLCLFLLNEHARAHICCVQAVERERDSLSQEVDMLRDTIQQLESEIRLHDKDRRYDFSQ